MAFWGIEVKPGKPVSHSFDKVRRRLRISQATLGIGSAITKSLVQCNVGNKSPVFICALLPEKTESCHLDLEFEEVDDVVFSVIGPRSVYLTGYYVSNDRHSTLNSDTESYGEDIENTESEESGHHSDDDCYEDSFIDDGDPAAFPLSPDGVDEEMLDKKIREKKGRLQRNKFRIIDSDDEITSQNSEDDDNYLLSAFKSKKSAKDEVLEVGEKTGQVTVETNTESADCVASGHVSMEKADSVIMHKEPNRKTLSRNASFPSGEVTPEKEMELKESRHFSKEAETFGDNSVNQSDPPVHDEVQANTAKVDNMSGSLHASKEEHKSELAPVNSKKSKRKRKEHADGDKTLEGSNDNHKNALKEIKVLQAEADADNKHQDLLKPNDPNQKPTTTVCRKVDGDGPSSLPHLACSENDQCSKKRRKKGSIKQGSGGSDDASSGRILVDDQMKENVLEHDRLVSDLPATTAEDKKPIADEKGDGDGPSSLPHPAGSENDQCSKKRRKKGSIKHRSGGSDDATSDRILVDDQLKENVLEDDRMVSNLPATTAEHKKAVADEGMKFEFVADGNQIEKPKKKKKKGKTQDDKENLNVSRSHLSENESRRPSMSSQVRTLSNGLVIEELALGEQVGKIAAVGKKVKVYYTAMLKESGRVFDSNIGKSPYKFRLGDEAIIEGWNIGLEGMGVGDKRRLVIPPSMGYGSQGAGENVPPNSWLVFDIELASVR